MPKLRIPNLTKTNKVKDVIHEDLDIASGLLNPWWNTFAGRYGARGFYGRQRLCEKLDKLFLSTFDVEDAIYKRDMVWELINDSLIRKDFEKIMRAIPKYDLNYVATEGEYGMLSLQSIKTQLNNIKKYLFIPETLELMTNISGGFECAKDLRNFGKRARKHFNDYAEIVKDLKGKPFYKGDFVDVEFGNHCVDKITPFLTRIKGVRSVRRDMFDYLSLCLPFEIYCENGEKIPICKPEFLEPEKRKGKIVGAYSPEHCDFVFDKGKIVMRRSAVPNNIYWGDNARNTFVQGPNSMGKTVYLGTIALNVHLAMAGLPCFAEYCELSPIRKILPCFDLGDSDNEGHFMTGANKINFMIDNVTLDDLVLMDETGGGTEPEAERIIAKGISDALIKNNITSYNVTHDGGAWKSYIGREGINFMRVADLNDEKRKYRVWQGVAKGGYAMKLARKECIDPTSANRRLVKRLR